MPLSMKRSWETMAQAVNGTRTFATGGCNSLLFHFHQAKRLQLILLLDLDRNEYIREASEEPLRTLS